MRNVLVSAVIASALVLAIITQIVVRVAHPEMTETQLLGRYWFAFYWPIVSIVLLMFAFKDDGD